MQMLDVSVNRPFKNTMRLACHDYFAEIVRLHVASGRNAEDLSLDTRMSTVKPMLPQWVRAILSSMLCFWTLLAQMLCIFECNFCTLFLDSACSNNVHL